MLLSLEKEPSTRLLRHVVGCYVRLSENERYKNYFENNSFSTICMKCINILYFMRKKIFRNIFSKLTLCY